MSATAPPDIREGQQGPPEDLDEGKGSRGATVIMVSAVVLLLLPFIPLFLHAFGDQYFFPQLIPDNFTVSAWRTALFENDRLWSSTFKSLRIAVAVTVICLAIGTPAARAMGLYTFRGRSAIEFALLTPVLVPTIAIGLGLQISFIRLGLSNSELGVILVHLVPALPYTVIILSGVFSNYQPEFEDQARTLGASRLRTVWFVMMPMIAPGLAVAAFFSFLISWSQYVLTLLIGGGSVITLPILVFSLVSGGNLRITSVVSLMFMLPAVLLLLLVARFLAPGRALSGGITKS